MSANSSELMFPQDLIPAGYDLSDEQWKEHVEEIIRYGQQDSSTSRQIDMSWSVVFVRLNKDLFHLGPRQTKTNILHISNPTTYAQLPEASSAENAEIETILPTNDEEEIKMWKLVPCSAQLRFSNTWVRFRCKLLESKGCPESFVIETKSNSIIDCKIYRMADDENGNRLLWVNMKAWRFSAPVEVELCCKKIVGDEVTRLSQVEERYVWEEDFGRFFEEPYVGV